MYTKILIEIKKKIKKIFQCFCDNRTLLVSLPTELKEIKIEFDKIRSIIIKLPRK